MLNQDYKEMLQCLQEEQVEFIIVGAYALAAHGFPRNTADFDIWVNPTVENSRKVYRALAQFGAPIQNVSPEDFAEQGIIFQIGVVPCRIDIITMISGGIRFVDAMRKSVTVELGEVTLPVLSVNDLITNKSAAGREKDMQDVRLLKEHRPSESDDKQGSTTEDRR